MHTADNSNSSFLVSVPKRLTDMLKRTCTSFIDSVPYMAMTVALVNVFLNSRTGKTKALLCKCGVGD